jgi:hypothetical protein
MDGVNLASPISSNPFSTLEIPTVSAKAATFSDGRTLYAPPYVEQKFGTVGGEERLGSGQARSVVMLGQKYGGTTSDKARSHVLNGLNSARIPFLRLLAPFATGQS